MCSTVPILNVIIFLWHHLKVLKRALIIKHKDWNKSREEGDDENVDTLPSQQLIIVIVTDQNGRSTEWWLL